MSKIEQNKEKKRQAIQKAAQDIFLSEGYVLASMDRIAAQAQVTKQTIYRYYPSKIDLFKATLQHMGNHSEISFLDHLQEPDNEVALYRFARGFIQAHLSKEHLATMRLLIAESDKAPEITSVFWDIGPNETDEKLVQFFTDRLGITHAETTVNFWTAILLAPRETTLIGRQKPTGEQIEIWARDATRFLLAATS